MNILVTGCAGFIGSHLCEALLKDNHTIIGIDNFDNYYNKAIKEDNLSNFINNKQFNLYELDIREREDILNIKEDINFIIHIAAKAGVRPSIEDPAGYIKTNIVGTENILELMRIREIKKMIFASSSSVYGNHPETPFNEEMDVNSPISPYAFTKKACELLNHTYHHLYDIDIINLRFFTVFGPRQRPDLAINKFARLISQGKDIPMYGDGNTSRDYTFISDIIDGIMKSFIYLNSNNKIFEILNLGNNTPILLKEMISTIAEELGKKFTIKKYEMQPGDVNKTLANIEKAKQLIGYNPKTSFREGIRSFINWSRKKDYMGIE